MSLVVVAHGALADQVGELTVAGSGLGVIFGRVHEAVHQHGTVQGKVVTIYVAIAFQPGGSHVVDAGALELEQAESLPFVIVVGEA